MAIAKIYKKYGDKLTLQQQYTLDKLRKMNTQIGLTKLVKGAVILDASSFITTDGADLTLKTFTGNYGLWKDIALALGATAVSKEDYQKFLKEYKKALEEHGE